MFKRDIDYIVKDEQDRHHRRVHRPDDGRPALVGRPSPGGRGQGRRRDRAREPDPRLDHLPELFPHVPQAVGHDRHRADRGAGILRHLQDERRLDPDQRAGPARSTRTTNSTRTSPTSSPPSPRRSRRSRTSASRSWSAPSRSRSRNCCREFLKKARIKHEVLNARFHEQEAHIVAQAGAARRGHHRHQHGRPRHRHPARRQRRVPHRRRARRDGAEARSATRRSRRSSAEVAEEKAAGARRRRPVRARHRAPREPPHRQPAARPLRPPGRSRACRASTCSLDDDLLRIFGPQTMFARLMNKNLEDGEAIISPVDLQGDRDRAEEGRGAQLRHPQAGRRI